MHTIPNTMKAVVLTKPSAAEDIILTDVSVPAVKSGWVLVKIHAFGLNHSEHILRQFEIEHDYIQKTDYSRNRLRRRNCRCFRV